MSESGSFGDESQCMCRTFYMQAMLFFYPDLSRRSFGGYRNVHMFYIVVVVVVVLLFSFRK